MGKSAANWRLTDDGIDGSKIGYIAEPHQTGEPVPRPAVVAFYTRNIRVFLDIGRFSRQLSFLCYLVFMVRDLEKCVKNFLTMNMERGNAIIA